MESSRARLLPKESALLPPDCICRSMKNQMAPSRRKGPTLKSNCNRRPLLWGSLMEKVTLAARSSLVRLSVLLAEMTVWNSSFEPLRWP